MYYRMLRMVLHSTLSDYRRVRFVSMGPKFLQTESSWGAISSFSLRKNRCFGDIPIYTIFHIPNCQDLKPLFDAPSRWLRVASWTLPRTRPGPANEFRRGSRCVWNLASNNWFYVHNALSNVNNTSYIRPVYFYIQMYDYVCTYTHTHTHTHTHIYIIIYITI